MPHKCSLNAFLNSQTNRLYFEFQLVYYSEGDLFSEEEENVLDKAIKLERAILQPSDDSNEDVHLHAFAITHENIGELRLNLLIEPSKVTVRGIKLGHLEYGDELGDCFEFSLDAAGQHGLCLDGKTLQVHSPLVELEKRSIGLCCYFCLTTSIDSYPSPAERDQSLCAVLQGPNVDLLSDWVFCGHSHSHSHADDRHNQANESRIRIPEELLKPIVLDRVEQVLYLLLADSPQILLESIDNMDNSIYLHLSRGDIYALKYSCSNQRSATAVEEQSSAVENKCTLFKSGGVPLDLRQKCLVHHQVFGQPPSDSSEDAQTRRLAYQAYYKSGDKKLLRKYRMSFEVEWYRIEGQLFGDLVDLLVESSETLRRLKDSFGGDDLIPDEHSSSCDHPVAVLETFKFVKLVDS